MGDWRAERAGRHSGPAAYEGPGCGAHLGVARPPRARLRPLPFATHEHRCHRRGQYRIDAGARCAHPSSREAEHSRPRDGGPASNRGAALRSVLGTTVPSAARSVCTSPIA